MLVVEVVSGFVQHEELAAVRVRARIRHAQHAPAAVQQPRVDLVPKSRAVDRLTTSPSPGGVAPLHN